MSKGNRELTDNPVVLRILDLLKKQKKTDKELTAFLGVSHSTITKWKYDGSNVYLKYIDPICEYLDTTPNYLFFGITDEDEMLTSGEKEMIRMYRRLDEARKNCVRDTIKFFLNDKVE